MFETQRTDSNPATGLRNPKLPQRLPAFLTEDESRSLLDLAPPTDFPSARLRCILELLYASGLRVSELTGLDLQDLLMEQQRLNLDYKATPEAFQALGERLQAQRKDSFTKAMAIRFAMAKMATDDEWKKLTSEKLGLMGL